MEQPRFGGVALPPLSHHSGEGKYQESNMDEMEKQNAEKYVFPQIRNDGNEDEKEKSSTAPQDPNVQKVLDILEELEISVHLEQHRLKQGRQREAGSSNSTSSQGVYCKNLLLKDKKGQAYLIICDEDDYADLQVVRFHLSSSGNLHFASKESLWSLLRVQPGALTPLALIHASARGVRVLIDASLVKRIDRDATKLFFHPLLAQFQVGLTLTQLENFLSYCGVALETLPSLVSYSSGRKYNFSTAGSRFKHMDHHESHKKSRESNMEEAARHSKQASSERSAMQAHQPEDGEEFLEPYKSLFEKLEIQVEVLLSNTPGNSFIPCRCVYLKDKRDGYFLFVCHEKQKVDFSNLKTQLKPRKKITPLDKQELLSVLNLTEDLENPFPLASVKQPRFLVAVADNLYQKNKAVLTFPHPTNSGLRLKVTLKDLEVFFQGVDHDLTTIPVKGSLESLLASSALLQACSASSTLTTSQNQSETEEKETVNLASTHELLVSSDLNPSNTPATASQKQNLFYHMTAPVRHWIIQWIRWFVRLLDRCLPGSISAKLQQSVLWQRMALTDQSGAAVTEDSKERLHNTEKQERRKRPNY
ncbi:uncharacterized protein [Littorina saxatilis]|uniref:PrdX deacylase domain-containing protein 1 n=1 Tax=Littorina saxatilis TaxID=31220 RepID=A0AAN9B5M8_9CAEN